MKKVLVLTLAMFMFVYTGIACAENVQTRESVVMIEGTEEFITETLYESPQGFLVWYPADLFAVTHEEGTDYFDTAPDFIEAGVAIVDGQMSYQAADEMLEAEIEMSIANGGSVIGEIEEWQLESGMTVKHAQIIYGDNHNPIYYLYGRDRVFCVSCYYPAEAAEGIGARIERMVSTFELAA